MEKIRVVKKECGCNPETVDIETDLEKMQNVVGGYMEAKQLGRTGVMMIWDEDARMKGRPVNIVTPYGYIFGTVIFCRSEGEKFASVTDADEKVLFACLEEESNE